MRLSTGSLLTILVFVAIAVAYVMGELDFLRNATSWQMGFSVITQTPSDPYWKTIGISVLNTVVLAAVSIALATVIGSLVAFLAVSGHPLWSRLAKAYVQVFRNMPLILQALFWFAVITNMPGPRQAFGIAGAVVSNRGVSIPFPTAAGLAVVGAALALVLLLFLLSRRRRLFPTGRTWKLFVVAALGAGATSLLGFPGEALYSVPKLQGFNFVGGLYVPTELLAVLIALSMFGSAYVAEIVRGGFATVPKGMLEAARALALPTWVVEWKVRVPLALRAAILPMGSQYTTLIKATSIGLAVGFTDLFAVTLMSINQSGHTVALLCVMTACFVLLNQLVVSIANALNHAFEVPGHGA